jgi:hypothetical protein
MLFSPFSEPELYDDTEITSSKVIMLCQMFDMSRAAPTYFMKLTATELPCHSFHKTVAVWRENINISFPFHVIKSYPCSFIFFLSHTLVIVIISTTFLLCLIFSPCSIITIKNPQHYPLLEIIQQIQNLRARCSIFNMLLIFFKYLFYYTNTFKREQNASLSFVTSAEN